MARISSVPFCLLPPTMAGRASELETHKAAASLKTAGTKDEALSSAISAAESLMKAFKLSSNSDERKQLKTKCSEIMSEADRIKKTKQWTPLFALPPTRVNNECIGHGAAEIATSSTSIAAVESGTAFVQPTGPFHTTSSSTPAFEQLSTLRIDDSGTPLPVSEARTSADILHQGRTSTRPGRSTEYALNKEIAPSVPTHAPSLLSQLNDFTAGTSATTSSTAPHSQIHRLREPISSRTLKAKEQIILLKSSMINGFKFPPWDGVPSPDEFLSQGGANPFMETCDLNLSPYQQQFFQAWLPAKQAVPPPSLIPHGSAGVGPVMSSSRALDLVQDAASDCSVVTSLCAGAARAERGHDQCQIIRDKLYPYDKQRKTPVLSSNGKYIARFYFNGCWRKVVIDDRLPVSNTYRLLHVHDRRNPALLWPPLLEKAYLKVRGGYDFPGSSSCSDLFTMTGWIPEQVFLQETDTVPDHLWKRIYNAFMYGDVLVTAGTGRMTSKQEREVGLEAQHSYAVLDMREIGPDRLLLVKNPWVEGKGWRGPRPLAVAAMDASISGREPNNSLECYHRDSIPTQERPHPTTFWIGLEQVIQHFEGLYLNWNPGLFQYRQDVHFQWNVSAPAPGGCIFEHPQFAFVSKNGGPVWFLLSRHFRDTTTAVKKESDAVNDDGILPEGQFQTYEEVPQGYMSIYICNGRGERLYIKDTYLESSDYVTTPQCLLRNEVKANSAYTVVIDQDELPLSLYSFTLSAFANAPITLEPAKLRFPVQKLEEGAWTRQTAGGGTDSSRYFDNPQYSLVMREHGSLAILLTGTDHGHPLHVKVAVGHGKRLYRLQSRDVLGDSGNHRSGCVYAEIKDLQPGPYTLICSLFEPGLTGGYTLRVDSTSNIEVKQVPREGAGLLSMKLAPACFSPKVDKVAAPMRLLRLASYTIIARFMKATSPRVMDTGKLARSPLRLSVEMGRGPDRKFITASEGGSYADSAMVRSESVNMDPKLGMQGDIWLVLDRLSSAGGPLEEWYDVEIYVDTPKACEVGVWREYD
ncbi:cysteine protease [Pyrenophora seminiperda CCB06]|uniref:Cysteine protease n=1 Tax=Pyrenophora seminiperda CCB06 TaxID=1302712 RepID=A0A3M7M6X8_9PLEO|nr:cysteine protease [Pyrenophora seminiperda CCB06]